jgi:predicted AlkP superfamily phosphohydrolase/phosphomutase
MLSDHGFCKLENQFNVNALLKTLGFLKFLNMSPKGLEDVSSDSIAFAMDPGRIYINSQDRFENGKVRASGYDETVARVQSAFQSLKFQDVGLFNPDIFDMPLFESVRTKKDVYCGNRLSNAPDLVIVPHRGYDVKGALSPSVVCSQDIFTGMHVHDDAFLFLGDGFETQLGTTAQITQVKDIILRSFRDFS